MPHDEASILSHKRRIKTESTGGLHRRSFLTTTNGATSWLMTVYLCPRGLRALDRICAEWLNFEYGVLQVGIANGYCDDLTLDRQKNHSGYSPDNCHWVTRKEQEANKKSHGNQWVSALSLSCEVKSNRRRQPFQGRLPYRLSGCK
jgi:hypothetical protein